MTLCLNGSQPPLLGGKAEEKEQHVFRLGGIPTSVEGQSTCYPLVPTYLYLYCMGVKHASPEKQKVSRQTLWNAGVGVNCFAFHGPTWSPTSRIT